MRFSIITPQAAASPDPALVDELAGVHVESWRATYGAQLPERFFDASARARRQEMWARLLSRPELCARTRLALAQAEETPADEPQAGTAGTAGAAGTAGTTGTAGAAGTVIGFALADSPQDDDIPESYRELRMLYLRPDSLGCGAGQALLDAAIGTAPAVLWVAAENPRAQAFYRRNGFCPDGTTRTEAALDDFAEIRMRRDAADR